jgi:hypothetical protein
VVEAVVVPAVDEDGNLVVRPSGLHGTEVYHEFGGK